MDLHSGRILAMTGGFSFAINQFNRATQAWRQPGSSIKPFVYAAALDHGFTPASKVMDAPFVGTREGEFLWKPENYGKAFGGPTTLRRGLELSRNLMTLHLTNEIGLGPVIDYIKRFGLATDIRPDLSLALGAEETTLQRLVAAYAMIANGGKYIAPFSIERVQNRLGRVIYKHDRRACRRCNLEAFRGEAAPVLLDTRARVLSPQTAYQVISMMQGVVKRGTGTRAKVRGMILAGKTGTTNKERDAWFVGFSHDLAVGVYVGFDMPRPMGKKETGARVTAPIFADFMRRVKPDATKPFHIPPGVTLVRINRISGKPTSQTNKDVIWEAFKVGTEPGRDQAATIKRQDPGPSFDSDRSDDSDEGGEFNGTGGLY